MSIIQANGIDLKVEEYGPSDGPVLLLISGWSVQLTFWPKPFLKHFTDAGFRVIIFDNRDVGLSQKFKRNVTTYPFAPHIMASRYLRRKLLVAYTLEDMAADAIGILDTVDIPRAHILGLSMGGMIAQIVAAKYPKRVRSTSILMSSSNRFGLPLPPSRLLFDVFFKRRSRDPEKNLAASQRIWQRIRTQDGGYPPNDLSDTLTATIDRANYPAGRQRQLEAIMATGDLRRFGRKIVSPTLVIHGSADLLSRPHGGVDVAENIKGAKFELIDGLGHDLPPSKIDQIAKLVIEHARAETDTKKRLKRVV
ncbi:MAG: alpha/beta hydrolase [Pseudomonadota bacterium]